MAAGWVKSLQCKSRAVEDVYNPIPKQLLPASSSCRNSVQSLKDVIGNSKNTKPIPKPKPKAKPRKPDPNSHHHDKPTARRSESVSRKLDPFSSNRIRRTVSAPITKTPPDPFFPSLSELPGGHPSRNVVEIIFHTRWGPKGFSGQVEMVFKIQNMNRAVARFEEYRESVKSRAGSDCGGDSARSVADGNEMMRFHCLGPTFGAINGGDDTNGGSICGINGGKGSTVCTTYSGSGAAHDNAGGGRGRRAMLVCRVIAGRVWKRVGFDPVVEESVEFDSVSGENGELVVFDSRAVLPCFLVIYKL